MPVSPKLAGPGHSRGRAIERIRLDLQSLLAFGWHTLNLARTLDTALNPHQISIHRAILARLIPVWLLLSLLLGGGAYWIESQRVNRFVLSLSIDAIQRFEPELQTDLPATPPARLKARLDALLQHTQFSGIRLYGPNRQLLNQSWHQPGLSRAIPLYDFAVKRQPTDGWHLPKPIGTLPLEDHILPGSRQQQALRIDQRFYVLSLQPLRDRNGQLQGYLEGIYQIAPETARAIGSRIGDTLIGVLLVITLASAALYPLIVSLSRDSIRLSHNLLASNVELMRVLGSAIAKRDSDTDSHNYRVTLYAIELAQAMQRPAREIIALMAGAFLHDVGKIGISDSILLKPARLTEEEFRVMKTHVNIGLEIIGEVKWLQLAEEVIACHHERFDGSGYPFGLQGQQIPFNARLFAIVDVFDALTSKRPYKEALPFELAMALMRKESGSHFDPQLFSQFSQLASTLYARYHQAETPALRRMLTDIAVGKYFRQH